MSEPWIGVDLDGILAHYDNWKGIDHIGDPISVMVSFVLDLCNSGKTVKIFTARATVPEAIPYVKKWCLEYLGRELEVVCCKDFGMLMLYDDRAITIKKNEGVVLTDCKAMIRE